MVSCCWCFKSTHRPRGSTASLRGVSTLNPDEVDDSSFGEMHSAVDCIDRNLSFMSMDPDEEIVHWLPPNSAIDQGQRCLKLLKRMITEKVGFLSSGSVGETKLMYLPRSSSCDVMVTMGEIDVQSTIPHVDMSNYILNLDSRSIWDPQYLMGQQVGNVYTVNNNLNLRKVWLAFKSAPRMAGRDFLNYTMQENDSETAWIVSWGVPKEEIPDEFLPGKKSPPHVRGTLRLGGFRLQRLTPTCIQITFINQADIGVSAWLSEPALRKNPKFLNGLKTFLETVPERKTV